MYLTSGANVSTIRFRSWGSFVSRYFFQSARVSSWETRLRVLGSSFIGSSGSFREGRSRLDRPGGRRPLAKFHDLPTRHPRPTKLRRAPAAAGPRSARPEGAV